MEGKSKVKLNAWDLWKVYKSKNDEKIKNMDGRAMVEAIDKEHAYFRKMLHRWQFEKGYIIDWEGEGVLQYFKS